MIVHQCLSMEIAEFCGVQTPDSSPHGSPFNNTDRLNYHAQLNANGQAINQPTSAGHLLLAQQIHHSQLNHPDSLQQQQLHAQSQQPANQASLLGQQLHQSNLLNNCASPHSTAGYTNGSTGNVPNGNLVDVTRSLPTPEMSPPENISEKEHYLHLYGHQNNHRFNQNSAINVQQNSSNSQTGSTQLYQIINNQARHSPGALSSSSSVCSTNNNSTNNSSVYSVASAEQQASGTNRTNNDNPVTELISKFSPNSSTFLKNVCPPFQRGSTPQTSPTPPNYEQQLHHNNVRYQCQPMMDQSQMYAAKRTAYAYTPNIENGQITWSAVYEQQQNPQVYSIYKQEMIKQSDNYGSDQLGVCTNENYGDYYGHQQQQYASHQEQMMDQAANDHYLHGGHLLQTQHVQQHHLQGEVQSQQIAMMQMQQYGREDSSFINALTEAQEAISS